MAKILSSLGNNFKNTPHLVVHIHNVVHKMGYLCNYAPKQPHCGDHVMKWIGTRILAVCQLLNHLIFRNLISLTTNLSEFNQGQILDLISCC